MKIFIRSKTGTACVNYNNKDIRRILKQHAISELDNLDESHTGNGQVLIEMDQNGSVTADAVIYLATPAEGTGDA